MIAAFFDMDRTLIRCNSGTEWIRYLYRRGELSKVGLLRGLGWVAQYKLSVLDIEAVTTRVVGDMAGQTERDMVDKCLPFFDQVVWPAVTRQGRAALERHRALGHEIALLSSSSQYVASLLAERLGIEHVLCTRIEAQDGIFTGRYARPACYGEGKIHWAEGFATPRGISLGQSWFYTDSYTDLPMLERVGHRVVVNPDARLQRHARRVGWTVERWS